MIESANTATPATARFGVNTVSGEVSASPDRRVVFRPSGIAPAAGLARRCERWRVGNGCDRYTRFVGAYRQGATAPEYDRESPADTGVLRGPLYYRRSHARTGRGRKESVSGVCWEVLGDVFRSARDSSARGISPCAEEIGWRLGMPLGRILLKSDQVCGEHALAVAIVPLDEGHESGEVGMDGLVAYPCHFRDGPVPVPCWSETSSASHSTEDSVGSAATPMRART